jgi:subtilase family serine protease
MTKPVLKLITLIVGVIVIFFFGFHFSAGAAELPNVALDHIPVCTVSNPDTPRCHARVKVDKGEKVNATTSPTGYGPAQFLAAYNLSGTVTTPQTIAIVVAFDHPNIFSDLTQYSTSYGLPLLQNCPVSGGTPTTPCFQKIDQRGGTLYPSVNSGWALETALDVETVHAICQNCNILLVEADSNSYANLMAAVDRAVAMGAQYISNSYGSSEFGSETLYDYHFNVPGVAITFSSGDSGYGTSYPAASRYVTSVGGTTLNMSGVTYLGEQAWKGAGSGCSLYESKPSWQKDGGCARRSIADVSADADPNTGASVYDTVSYNGQSGWFQVGGTSLASPIIAAVYALASDAKSVQYPSSLPYLRVNYTNTMRDITTGANGKCRRTPYLCTAVLGYDGPTGLGTPFTPGAF